LPVTNIEEHRPAKRREKTRKDAKKRFFKKFRAFSRALNRNCFLRRRPSGLFSGGALFTPSPGGRERRLFY
jgi:hypothetical protein